MKAAPQLIERAYLAAHSAAGWLHSCTGADADELLILAELLTTRLLAHLEQARRPEGDV